MNIRKIVTFAIGPIGSAALGFITLPVITWLYSAEDIGRIAMLQVASSFCILLFSLGLDQAYVREYHETRQKPALLKATLTPGLLILAMVLGVTLLVPEVISNALFSVQSTEISWLVATCLLAGFITRFLSLILRMQERGLAFSMSQILPKALFLMIIGSFYILSFGFNFFYLIIAHSISILAVTLVFAWNTRTEWLVIFRHSIDSDQLKSMLRFGMPLIIGGLAYWGLTAMDRLFLRNLSTFEELGIYSVASNFAAAAIIFQNVFSTVWAPTVYKWASEGINNEKIDLVTDYVLAAVVCIFALAGLFSWIAAWVLPEKYEGVQYLLTTCMSYPLFYTLSETTVVGLGITRKTGYSMLASLIAALISLAGNALLIPSYGATGAAISTAVAFWFFLICRTEMSCLVWRKIPRKKLYILSSICLTISVASAYTEGDHLAVINTAWILLLTTTAISYRSALTKAFQTLRNRKTSATRSDQQHQ